MASLSLCCSKKPKKECKKCICTISFNKLLGRRERKQCNTMTYCSVACQREDWLDGGHKLACCKQYTNERAGHFQGRFWPLIVPESERAAGMVKELEVNTAMIQLKLFLDNSETILTQAVSLGVPLSDCFVWFDLRVCPLMVEVKTQTKLITPKEEKNFEECRSKDNITCIYWSYIFNSELGEDYGRFDESEKVPNLFMQRFFPHAWLSKK